MIPENQRNIKGMPPPKSERPAKVVMDTLDRLVEKKLLQEDYTPVPLTTPLKVVRSVLAQQHCHNGLRYDIAVSWLQKAIRRGRKQEAMYCAYQIAHVGKMFCNHLLNRLLIILSEDIGPAEVGLVPLIKKAYCEGRQLTGNVDGDTGADGDVLGIGDRVGPLVMEMISLLCQARKSRIVDWLHHQAEAVDVDADADADDFKQMTESEIFLWIHKHSATELTQQQQTQTQIDYTDDGVSNSVSKGHPLYKLWSFLLSNTLPETACDTMDLFNLYLLRGVQYGTLFLAHATVLYTRKVTGPSFVSLAEAYVYTPADWQALAELNPPVLNAAVDMHTLHGRKYLGRDMYDFLKYGSRLENWTPFTGEREYVERMLEVYKRHVDSSVPRPYQDKLGKEAVSFLRDQQAGWLVMACGSGKTKTGFWVADQLTRDYADCLVVVVAPYLNIMRQFFQVWAYLNRGAENKIHTGIAASCRDKFRMDDYTSYEYLNELPEFASFLSAPGRKYLFTTYASMRQKVQGYLTKLNVSPAFVLYDEAHHVREAHLVPASYSLFLTATPPISVPVIGTYHLEKAISDGVLTDYRIRVFDEMDLLGCMTYISLRQKRTIIYCRTNMEANVLRDEWTGYCGDEVKNYSISASTPQKERDQILSKFTEGAESCSFIFSCRTLGEGVDIPACDSIFIVSGVTGETSVMQAVGRPLRKFPGKEMACVYMMQDKAMPVRLRGLQQYDSQVMNKIELVE